MCKIRNFWITLFSPFDLWNFLREILFIPSQQGGQETFIADCISIGVEEAKVGQKLNVFAERNIIQLQSDSKLIYSDIFLVGVVGNKINYKIISQTENEMVIETKCQYGIYSISIVNGNLRTTERIFISNF